MGDKETEKTSEVNDARAEESERWLQASVKASARTSERIYTATKANLSRIDQIIALEQEIDTLHAQIRALERKIREYEDDMR